ncbi:MAG: GH36-type glycosyl hydrolase domain-containing protein [Candidatus Helarchaeota archaeon]
MAKKAFGSGYFGEWIVDSYGLPAYRYTCDQINDEKAKTPVNEMWRKSTEHLHEVGNDRLVAVVSNYGHVLVRQDEGAPKFLNDHNPAQGSYAGGFGYLTDGTVLLSSYYPGNCEKFERIFGMGYYRKTISGAGLEADQLIFAPFGDDPLVISQVTITNKREKAADLRWIEYWGCQMYQFSYRSFIRGLISKKLTVPERRRNFSKRFRSSCAITENRDGMIVQKQFKGRTFGDRLNWAIINFFMATFFRKLSGGRVKSPVKEVSFEDKAPPPIFLVSLDAPPDGFSADPRKFFGEGGILAPSGIAAPLPTDLPPSDEVEGLFLERKFHLAPGAQVTLYFAFGYLPENVDLPVLLKKYQKNPSELFTQSCEKWKQNRISLKIANEPWVDRELHWHHYYLRGNLTYDTFFKEHILSQGHVYQYLIGFQGAARDPLQHALPFIFTDPTIVKEVLRYTLKEVQPNGAIPYGITGSGMIQPAPFAPSDLELWLLWLTSEYVLATRDRAFLEENLPTYPLYGKKAGRAKVKELLVRCYRHLIDTTGTGKHGLLRLSNGDWNDGVVHGNVPRKKIKQVTKEGESVLNAAMASYVLTLFAQLLEYIGDDAFQQEVIKMAEMQRKAVHNQWTGKWFRRAWLSEELGWVGVEELWLEPQPWAIIGGAADSEQRPILTKTLDAEVRQPSKIGATLLNKVIKKAFEPPGMGTVAGIWPSINGTLIWSLALVDGKMAWDEWKKNTLAIHAETYPEVWYGIWSGPDTYNSHFSHYPGQTVFIPPDLETKSSWTGSVRIFWTDFPVMNMHPHAWPLYSLTKLLGIQFTPQGISINPTLPKTEYHFNSPLIGLEKSKNHYSGWYAPLQSGIWTISLNLNDEDALAFSQLQVNDQPTEFVREGTQIHFQGKSTPDAPLRWELTKAPPT